MSCYLESEKFREDLAELQTEISIKERLVEELEKSHNRLVTIQVKTLLVDSLKSGGF